MASIFYPYPDPTRPETMTSDNIRYLRVMQVISVQAWPSLEAFKAEGGTDPKPKGTGKTWCDTGALVWKDSKRYKYLRLLRDEAGRPVHRPIDFSDEMFSYMPPSLAQCYRSRPGLFQSVPIFRRVEYSAAEAGRLNFHATPVEDIPVGRFHDDTNGEVAEGTAFPTNVAFWFRPDTDIVDFFYIERFLEAYPDVPAQPIIEPVRRLPDAVVVATAHQILDTPRTDPATIQSQAAALRQLATL